MVDVQHYCSTCGEIHGGTSGKPPEVRIAEINAERDVAIAQMEYREAQEVAAVEAETAVVVTELETESAVAVAVETDPPVAEAPDDGNQSIIVEGPPADAGAEPEPSIPPADEQGGEPVSAAPKSGNPWWG